MIIDIVEMTEEEFALLSLKQVLILRAAQAQKDKLTAQLEEDKKSVTILLLANNMARSTLNEELCLKLEREYNEKVDALREQTIFNVANSTDLEDDDPVYTDTPYLVDYNTSMVQRMQIVETYYLSIEDPSLRMRKYANDNVAKKYLGDYYTALYAILEQYSTM